VTFKRPAIPVEVTYADLVDGDHLVDKSGNEWLVAEVAFTVTEAEFWLCDTVTKVKAHRIVKPLEDAVTVKRTPDHAGEVKAAEAEVDEAQGGEPAEEPLTLDEVKEALGAEVIAEESAAEADARNEADAGGSAVELPGFHEFTEMEMRSHLYLLHGVYAEDVKARQALVEMHNDLHESTDLGRFIPHTHTEGKEFPA
jgi:hypothetical protein